MSANAAVKPTPSLRSSKTNKGAIDSMKPEVVLHPSKTNERARSGLKTHRTDAPLDELHALLGHLARQYIDTQKVRIATGNRVSAMQRDGMAPATWEPFNATQEALKTIEGQLERQLAKHAKKHPMAEWIEAQPGVSPAMFAQILGVTGPFFPVRYHGINCLCQRITGTHAESAEADETEGHYHLENPELECPQDSSIAGGFPTVSKLWRYMGMSVDDGQAPKRRKGEKLNYSPRGRVLCHLMGEGIVKVGRGPYRALYDQKKEAYSDREWTPLHKHNAAMRYAVKCFLRDLWVEWASLSDA